MTNFVLSVLILQYNSSDLTVQLLESIEQHEECRLQDYRFVLMDNASVDPKFTEIAKRFPWIELVSYEENLGFGRAHNKLIPTIKEEWVLLLNNDCILLNDALTRTLLAAQKQRADFATCAVLNEDLTDQANFSTLPSPLQGIFLNLTGITRLLWFWRRRVKIARVGYVNGAFLLLRRSAIPQNQLFDNRYFMYTEDMDLMFRLAKQRAKGYRFASGKVIHLGGRSSVHKWTVGQIDCTKFNQTRECLKNHYPRWQVNLKLFIFQWIKRPTRK